MKVPMANPRDSTHGDAETHVSATANDCLCRRAAGETPGDGDEIQQVRPVIARGEGEVQPFEGDTSDEDHCDAGSGRLEVRCPNCRASMKVAVDTRLTDLKCGACGIHFSLVDQSQATRTAPSLSKLGRFELVERLGVGGFGSVWKARDKELDRTVAIKIPRAAGIDDR
jgi:hypothetical protein